MARFNANDADKYGEQGGGGFFQLKNDKDVATVRFLYDSIDDVEGLSVHTVQLGDKKRYVNCLREYNDSMDVCPFCRDGKFTTAKLFIPVYDVNTDKLLIWERGKKFFSKMSSLCSRYPNLVSHVFEIERNGMKGDTATTYEIYEVDKDDTTMEDMPEVPDIVGGIVLDKSADDMEYYLQNGDFPADNAVRGGGRGERSNGRSERNTETVRRRTPANRRRSENGEDVY